MMNVVNFGHGALFLLGGYIAYQIVARSHLSFWAALIVAPLALGVIGIAIEILILRPIYDQEPIVGLLATYGMTLIVQTSVIAIWGSVPKTYNVPGYLSTSTNLGITSEPISGCSSPAWGSSSPSSLPISDEDPAVDDSSGGSRLGDDQLPRREHADSVHGHVLHRPRHRRSRRDAPRGGSGSHTGPRPTVPDPRLHRRRRGWRRVAVRQRHLGTGGRWAMFLAPVVFGSFAIAARHAGYNALAAVLARLDGSLMPYLIMIVVLLVRPRGLFGQEGLLE